MLTRTLELLQEGIEKGQHPGGQMYVSQNGAILADEAIGESSLGTPMRTDSLMLWLSSGKPVTAIATLQQVERGGLTLDERVEKLIPEFGQGGKGPITIRQLLTHTGGFRPFGLDWPRMFWEDVIAAICETPLEEGWIPGGKAGYHTASSWFILAELVRRVSGKNYSEYVRGEIFLPLGMDDCWVGMPIEKYRSYGERISTIYSTQEGKIEPREWTSELHMTGCSPGGGAIGPANQLGILLETLLNGGERDGVRILESETVRLMTSRQRIGIFDETFNATIDWGLGFVINSRPKGLQMMPYGYGNFASDNTFGHSGYQSSTAFADPAHGLVVVIITNGMPGEARNHRRMRMLDNALYEELGLAQNAGK